MNPCKHAAGRFPLYDCHGIFLTYVCDDCEAAKRQQYRPETFSGYSQADLDELSGERIEAD